MKLLVATEFPPNASGGGPAVVRQMLKDWPAENLFWWSCLPETNQHFGRRVQELRGAAIPKKLYPYQKFSALKSALLDNIWAPWAGKNLSVTVRELQPDVVWMIPHNWSIAPLSQGLSGNWPGCHVTVQDYVDVHDNPRRFGRERCRRLASLTDQLYTQATTRDATSHPMIADLKTRTGKDAAQMIHAGLEEADLDFLRQKQQGGSAAIRIAYAGTILVEEVFELFVAAMGQIRSALRKPLELHLFGAHSYAGRRWFNRDWMMEHGNLPEPALLIKLRECDWAFAPMALTDDDPRYNRFSFPTKFITYLAAGLPVITVGHPESSVMKMAAQYGVGLSTSIGVVALLAEKLKLALDIPGLWECYGNEIRRCAETEFVARRMRQQLYQCFAQCAEATAIKRG